MHIVFTGTESTFKTAIAKRIAAHFNLSYVPEYSRTYLEEIAPYTKITPLSKEDYDRIEEGQLALLYSQGYYDFQQPKIFDTDGMVLHIWKADKFDCVDDKLLEIPRHIVYFLCYPNVAPVEDPLRVDIERRDVLHEKYMDVLNQLPNTIIHLNQVTLENRVLFATTEIQRLLNHSI